MTTRNQQLRQARTAQNRVERTEAKYREAVAARDDLVRTLAGSFTLREIAQTLGVSHQAVSKMQRGGRHVA